MGAYGISLAAVEAEKLSSRAACPPRGESFISRDHLRESSPQAGFSGTLGTYVPHGSQGEKRTARLRELSMRRAASDAQFTVPAELCSMKVKEDDPARSEGNSTSPNSDGYAKASIPQELLHQKETLSSLYHLLCKLPVAQGRHCPLPLVDMVMSFCSKTCEQSHWKR